MAGRRRTLPEHDLTLHLVHGKLTSTDVSQYFRSLDSSCCATHWLHYFDPTVDMAQVDIASVPKLKRIIVEKRRELFGDAPKPFALVCASEGSQQYFFGFWSKYFVGPDAQAENWRCFRSLEEAYDWLELPQASRAAVARAIEDWEMARATDDRERPAAAQAVRTRGDDVRL
jgi:hypothetical protein